MPGQYPDTRWRHSTQHDLEVQHFAKMVTAFVAKLEASKDFLNGLAASGGEGEIVVQFLGDGYYGDTLPRTTLARIAQLGLGLGLEVYPVAQNRNAIEDSA